MWYNKYMIDIPKLDAEMEQAEPALEEVMQFHPAPGPEGWCLRGSVCGFASNTLAKYLRTAKLTTRATPKIRALPEALPRAMRRHIIVDTEVATIDPTYSQFMRLTGLDPMLAAEHNDMAALYPDRCIAVIPKGCERGFGERFASYALECVQAVREVRRIEDTWPVDDSSNWMSQEELFAMLAGIWDPTYYTVFDNEGDGELQAQRAAQQMLVLAREAARRHV